MPHKTEQIPFAGRIDLDTPPQDFPKGWGKNVRNVIWRGPDGDMRGENMAGTRLIPNLILPAGVNCCIGGLYEQVNAEVYYCNYNSNGNHAIYIYNIKSELIKTLNVDSDVLDFDPARPIHSMTILYGDEISGNLLFWLNSSGVPQRVNIKQALAGDYGAYREQYINVIKRPPDIPPGAAYENTSLTVNNERKQLFKFKYWFEYETFEDSVTSAHSVMPVPLDPFDTSVDSDPTKNSGVGLIIQTGDPTVKKIHLACAYNTGDTYSDFFEIDLLVKADLGISSDDIYLYRFYNDKAYINIATNFSTLLYDRVPREAGAQELMNGNTPIYANYLEGYNAVKPNVSIVGSAYSNQRTLTTAAMIVAQKGKAVGTVLGEPIHIIITGIATTGDSYYITTTSGTFGTTSIGTTIAAILTDIAGVAGISGFTIVSIDANNLVIQKAGERLLSSQRIPSTDVLGSSDVTPSSDWWSREAYALSYYDADGRTNGAFVTNVLVNTSPYLELTPGVSAIPYVDLYIYHQPPVWADYFHILRTNDISKLKFIQWISDRTFKDNLAGDDGNMYAYISIENLYQYIKDHSSSDFLAYDFAAGDRIRFIKLFPLGAITDPVIYSGVGSDQPAKDYEIQGALLNPEINGQIEQGQFIKILLPTVNANFDFGVQPNGAADANIDYSNYFIELYTPALPATENLNEYFEFNQRYSIIDAGTDVRRHQGSVQNQSANYVTPSRYTIRDGLHYARYRSINAANKLKYTLLADADVQDNLYVVPMSLTESFNSVGWTAQSTVLQRLTSPLQDDTNWMINVTDGNSYTFDIRGTITLQALNSKITHYRWVLQAVDISGAVVDINLIDIFSPIINKEYTFVINTSFTVPATYIKVFLYAISFPDVGVTCKIIAGDLTITQEGRTYSQLCIDPNFSDSFKSAVNSNGRALVFDPNAAETRFPTGAKYGLNFQKDTNINDSNRFYPENADSYNAAYGPVMKYRIHGEQLRIFQYRRTGAVGVYRKWITQADGSNQLITTQSIITPDNINYYDGDYGIGNQNMAIASYGYVDYFPDPVRGYLLRLSMDGITPISDLYKAQTWAGNTLPPYTTNIPYTYGGYAKLLGTFNMPSDRPGEYICFAQQGHSVYGVYNIYDIGGEALAFEEKRNAFTSKYDINPDFVMCAENKLIVWRGGQLYIMDDTDNYNTFFEEQHDSVVQIISRDPKDVKKDYTTISLNAPKPVYGEIVPLWQAPVVGDVLTSLGQQSNILEEDFYFDQDMYHAPVQGEWDTQYGVINGNEMKGLFIDITLRNSSTKFTFISSLYLNWLVSQKNF